MEFLNSFLRSLPAETRKAIWYGSIVFSAVILSLLQYYYGRKTRGQSARSIAILSFVVFCDLSVITYAVDAITDGLIFPSGSTYFVPYLLLVTFALNKLLKIPCLVVLDQTAIANIFARAVTITGCSFAGCCQGVSVSWGIYSAIRRETAVPIRIFEQILLLGLWFFLDRYYKKHGYDTGGKCAAIAMIAFGFLNVITDMFTVEPKLIYVTSIEGVFAFLTMCVGLVLLYIIDNKKTQGASAETEACTN